ncbi:MAG: DUF1972 domain-containing protein [Candidatus Manganitrophus sp.]|nr:DUF1972 domain-containing protein [Candidatus Manganitrophus sp.]MDC4223259.1 DUF1972 domain-containing protein [Candidatus Manganitrophus sp.]WDT71639.1 MAG: DUF1972 domain-containing protein [Candidatus Manganitrophus sp.]WDT81013.1 MAG: DUF1972 domain-containing protein [Candidatus Manganitrophus sp.]
MKIAILGTRGIPNNYGGFEQIAENLSLHFVQKGHEVTVYNPDEHPYHSSEWNQVRIKHIFSKETNLGIWGTLIYDYLCLKEAAKEDYDIILEMGYVPGALFFGLKKRSGTKLVTNMDGLDWKRSKWNYALRKFTKFCEMRAVKLSDLMISDNLGIKKYIIENYNKSSRFIPYGAELFYSPKEEFLKKFDLEVYKYYMIVARLEPENNIEMILDGYVGSKSSEPFAVIGNHTTKYGIYLKNKYRDHTNIKFLGGIYQDNTLNSLRWFSKLYFHGHSVGGTNPSLLEAMACNAYIAAHDNPFNKNVVQQDAFYFRNSEEISDLINSYTERFRDQFIKNNREKIKTAYNWEKVSEQYLDAFESVLRN